MKDTYWTTTDIWQCMIILIFLWLIDVNINVVAFRTSSLINQIRTTRNYMSIQQPHQNLILYTTRTTTTTTVSHPDDVNVGRDRFDRTASPIRHIDEPCIIIIDDTQYNVTSWAKAHPGGVAILQKFHHQNATKSFYAAHHSDHAISMLQQFVIPVPQNNNNNHHHHQQQEYQPPQEFILNGIQTRNTNNSHTKIIQNQSSLSSSSSSTLENRSSLKRWKQKLITTEDPFHIHKCLGIFVFLHFIYRYFQILFTADITGGLGSAMTSSTTITRMGGRSLPWRPILCLVPHGLLSISSLLFHTVPRDRVIGQPMIWQEYRIHNIGFGLRSVITTLLCTLSIRYQNQSRHIVIRRIAVVGSCLSCVWAMIMADIATRYLRSNDIESTTATTPYWDGCSIRTQKRFKTFYAYCQFMATLACLLVTNPAFPFSVLLAIQVASLLMTLVRKGLLSTYGYHMGYTATLIAPYLVALRSVMYMKRPELLYVFVLGSILFRIRRFGVNKYVIWLPLMTARILYGDKYLSYNIW